jgi:FixJ family two-component response regulator
LPEQTPIVFIVDDDQYVCEAIEGLLRSAGIAARSFGSAAEFLGTAELDAFACVVLDVRLPGTSGLELQRELSRIRPALPIVFITGHGDIPTSVRAIKAGAIEFLPKPFRDQDLLNAVHQALEVARAERKAQADRAALRERFTALTPREHQVLELVLGGLLNKQIAAQLGISEVTVKIHRGQVMQKTQARSLADLVRLAERSGIAAVTF